MSSINRQANEQQATPLRSQYPATAGSGPTKLQFDTPENRLGRINLSAPEDSNTTPGTTPEK